jgi:hypothetical protein
VTTTDVITGALNLLDSRGWTRGSYEDEGCGALCLAGALYVALGVSATGHDIHPSQVPLRDEVFTAVYAELLRRGGVADPAQNAWGEYAPGESGITGWNDEASRLEVRSVLEALLP